MSVRCRPILRLLMSLLLLSFPATAIAQTVDHDVIIIGAGSAGQYAAYELDYLGFDVLVLEARPRRHGMLHPPQVIGTTEVHPMAESVTGSNSGELALCGHRESRPEPPGPEIPVVGKR